MTILFWNNALTFKDSCPYWSIDFSLQALNHYHQSVLFAAQFPPRVAWDNSRPMENNAAFQTGVYANFKNKCHCHKLCWPKFKWVQGSFFFFLLLCATWISLNLKSLHVTQKQQQQLKRHGGDPKQRFVLVSGLLFFFFWIFLSIWITVFL